MGVLYFSEVPLTGVTIEYQPARTVGPPSHQPSREFASQCLQVAATWRRPRAVRHSGAAWYYTAWRLAAEIHDAAPEWPRHP
jgi:hypothetical protein